MTNQQLYLAIGIPILTNAALIGLLLAYINAKFDGINVNLRPGLRQTVKTQFAVR